MFYEDEEVEIEEEVQGNSSGSSCVPRYFIFVLMINFKPDKHLFQCSAPLSSPLSILHLVFFFERDPANHTQ
jgi:hypothetical protein